MIMVTNRYLYLPSLHDTQEQESEVEEKQRRYIVYLFSVPHDLAVNFTLLSIISALYSGDFIADSQLCEKCNWVSLNHVPYNCIP